MVPTGTDCLVRHRMLAALPRPEVHHKNSHGQNFRMGSFAARGSPGAGSARLSHTHVAISKNIPPFCPQKYNQYNNAYYAKFNHAGLSAFVLTTGLVGLGLAFLAFGYVLRHGETLLKTTVVFSTGMCLGISVLGLFLGEMFMCICGLMGFVGTSMYTNAVWKRIPVSFFWRAFFGGSRTRTVPECWRVGGRSRSGPWSSSEMRGGSCRREAERRIPGVALNPESSRARC